MTRPVARSLARRVGRRSRQPDPPAGVPGPDSIEVEARTLRVGDGLRASFVVVGYPRDVRPGWLEPLLSFPGPIEVSVHVEPVPNDYAAERLRRQLARLESTRRLDADRGRLADPVLDVAADDARDLAAALARGETRLFQIGLSVTVRAADKASLERDVARVRAITGSLLLDARPTTFRALQGWLSALPLGLDLLRQRRTFDTAALAATFPFASAELSEPDGVLYGLGARSGSPVFWDRFAQANHNLVVLATSGAGKSYFGKLDALRWSYAGVEVSVVDPEDEYRRLAEAIGGVVVRLGASGVRLNPFDLTDESDALMRRGLFAQTFVAALLDAPLEPAVRAALDRAVTAAYNRRGITADPVTHDRPAPQLADVWAELQADDDPDARTLAARLVPYVTGSYAGLFNGPTTTRPRGHMVVFSLRHLPDELKAAGTLLALDRIWRTVAHPEHRRRRLVVVDEAWLLMRDPAGAAFLYRMAKSARKHWAGLTVITQDAADLLATDLGRSVVANASTHVLLRQAPQVIDDLAGSFRLSEGERSFLLAAPTGQGILVAGPERVAFHVVASTTEHELITTNPEFLASQERSDPNSGIGT